MTQREQTDMLFNLIILPAADPSYSKKVHQDAARDSAPSRRFSPSVKPLPSK